MKGKDSFLRTADGRKWHYKKAHLGSDEANYEIRRGAAVLLVRGLQEDSDGRYEPPTSPGTTRHDWLGAAVSEAARARMVFPSINLWTNSQGERLVYLWTDG
jgi:hypothetical protein